MLTDATWMWLTPAAPAAIAILRLPRLPGLLDRPLPAPGRAVLARLLDLQGAEVDEVLALGLEEGLELDCHGGPGIRQAVEAALQSHGLRPATTEDETGLDGRWRDLARTVSPAALAWRLARPDGPWPFASTFLEREPVVLITGPVNAGKSTLLNAWCGQARALVSPEPGTTRDLVEASAPAFGWRLRLIDSAGLRSEGGEVERAGQALVAAARAQADLVIFCAPAEAPVPAPEANDLLLHTKVDLAPAGASTELLAWASPVHVGELASARLLADVARTVLRRLQLPPASPVLVPGPLDISCDTPVAEESA